MYDLINYDDDTKPYIVGLGLVGYKSDDGWYIIEVPRDSSTIPLGDDDQFIVGGPYTSEDELYQAAEKHEEKYSVKTGELKIEIKKYEERIEEEKREYDRYINELLSSIKEKVAKVSEQGEDTLWKLLSSNTDHFYMTESIMGAEILKKLGIDVDPKNVHVTTERISEIPENLRIISTPSPVKISLGLYTYKNELGRVIEERKLGKTSGPLIFVSGRFLTDQRLPYENQGLTEYDVYGPEGSWFIFKDSGEKKIVYRIVSSAEKNL